MPEPSTQCVKLVRVWRPLVSDFDMVDISPCATVGSLKARFKDFTPPSAVEVIVNGELRGCHRHDEDPCAQDDLPLADGEFPENTVIHVNIHDAKTIADAREQALGESCTLFDNRMDAYDPINKLLVQRKGPHALADTLTEHERRRPPHVPPPTAAAAAAVAGSAEASEGPWQVASAEAAPLHERDVAILFPGQGSQVVGMGRALLASGAPGVAALFERASALLGYDLQKLCLEGPPTDLALTRYSQPAIFVVSLAAMAKLRHEQPELLRRVRVAAGFSLGEYTALVWAGALSFEDGLRVVKARAEAMHEAAGQAACGMASVAGLGDDAIGALLAEGAAAVGGGKAAYMANFMFPGGRTLSGDAAVLQWVCANAGARGAKSAKPLEVSGAFHSPFMEPARPALAEALRGVEVRTPRVAVYSNVTGRPYEDAAQVRTLLERQLVEGVKWEQSVVHMGTHHPCAQYVETGPGKQLKAMMRRIDNKMWAATIVVDV
eukprot:Transcript_28292.p1 GENE.Transcript_28292~~Transcript_28292.p1  ORF type:complete len:509 (-),score=168.81 Transcript_28292:76-1554(-)